MGYYSDGSDDDDHDGSDFFNFYDSDNQTLNNEDEPTEVDANDQTFNVDVAASQVGSRRVGKEPIIEHPPQVFIISDGSDSGGGGSGLDDEVELNHGVRDFVEDSGDSWDGKDDDDVVEPSRMGAGVMNSNYESEELHSWWNHYLMISLGMTVMMMPRMVEVHVWEMVRDRKMRK